MTKIEFPDDDQLKLLLAASWVGGIHDLLFRDTRPCLEEWKTHKERAAEGALLFEDGELDRFQFRVTADQAASG